MLKAKDEQEMTEWIEAFAEAKAAHLRKRQVQRDISNYSYSSQVVLKLYLLVLALRRESIKCTILSKYERCIGQEGRKC